MKIDKKIVEIILRIGIFGTFLGHGIFAIGVKGSWIPFLTYFGFSIPTASTLMPIIGSIDILIAFVALLKPIRIVLLYAFVWTFLTALMRPLTGYPIWDFVERTANWAVPLALLLLKGIPKSLTAWLREKD
jgi:hypothetical protein